MTQIFSDGGAKPNPGKAGFGVVIKDAHSIRTISEGYVKSTNNRMELLGVITGIEMVEDDKIEVYSDSKYVIDAVNLGWLDSWENNRWKRKREFIPNHDLWKRLKKAMLYKEISFHWVKGHNGHPENEKCDQLATDAIEWYSTKKDIGYKK